MVGPSNMTESIAFELSICRARQTHRRDIRCVVNTFRCACIPGKQNKCSCDSICNHIRFGCCWSRRAKSRYARRPAITTGIVGTICHRCRRLRSLGGLHHGRCLDRPEIYLLGLATSKQYSIVLFFPQASSFACESSGLDTACRSGQICFWRCRHRRRACGALMAP